MHIILLSFLPNITQGFQYFSSTNTSLFTGSTFSKNFDIFHEYLMQVLKLGGTIYHFKWVKVSGTASY